LVFYPSHQGREIEDSRSDIGGFHLLRNRLKYGTNQWEEANEKNNLYRML